MSTLLLRTLSLGLTFIVIFSIKLIVSSLDVVQMLQFMPQIPEPKKKKKRKDKEENSSADTADADESMGDNSMDLVNNPFEYSPMVFIC